MLMEMLPKRVMVYDIIFLCCEHCASINVKVKENNLVFIYLSVYFF